MESKIIRPIEAPALSSMTLTLSSSAVGRLQMQLSWLVHALPPISLPEAVCKLQKPDLGQYVQPNGLSSLCDVSITSSVVLSKLRYFAADSHSAESVML